MRTLSSCALTIVVVSAGAACGSGRAPPAVSTSPAASTAAPAPIAAAAAPAASLPLELVASLARARVRFAIPAGFSPVQPVDNPQWQYSFAMRASNGSVEVRIRVDDLVETLADAYARGEDHTCPGPPGCLDSVVNDLWLSSIVATASSIAGPHMRSGVTPLREDVLRRFNADAGAIAFVDPDPRFGSSHAHAAALIVHKDHRADIIAVVLFDDPDTSALDVLGDLRFER
jgi:hypothetical protein